MNVVSSGVLWCLMADDENNWTRLTLRLPPRVHQWLLDTANGRSLNKTIVLLLESAMNGDDQKLKSYEDVRAAVLEDLRQEMRDMIADMQREK